MARRELPVPRLDLPEEELQKRFDTLQEALIPLWKSISQLNQDEQTIVVVPSVSLDFALRPSEMQAYEERLLFLLLLLRQPRARMVYVTGQPVSETVIDYYLALLPGLIPSHARARLFMLSVGDADPIPLTHKMLQRPRLIERIKHLVIDPGRAHLVPFNTTWAERDLALRLGIPMYGNDPRHEHLGSKSGSRQLFKQAGSPAPPGSRTFDRSTTSSERSSSSRRPGPSVRRPSSSSRRRYPARAMPRSTFQASMPTRWPSSNGSWR